MSLFSQDLKYALRRLTSAPGFALVAILSLAFGIGANTAVFSVVRGVLLRPLPFENSERLAMITRSGDVSIPDAEDWRRESKRFDSIALFLRSWAFDLTGEGEPERLQGVVAEPDLFTVLRIQPILGRLYTAADNRLGADRVAVISEGLWRERFAGDSGIVGRTILLSDNKTTVIGVLPERADVFEDGTDLWAPPATETPWALAERGTNNFDAMGRLASGATMSQAITELDGISRRLAQQFPSTNAGKIVVPTSLHDFLVGDSRTPLLVLLGAVGLVLLIVCANLANLLLARAAARQHEMALRQAVGASRGRLVRQLLTESVLLSAVGGIAGVLLAFWGTEALLGLAPASLAGSETIRLDSRVLAFTFTVTVLTGLGFGLLPALRASNTDPQQALRGEGRSSGSAAKHRLLGSIVVMEVALAFVLLVGGGLLTRSFLHMLDVPLGFRPANVLTAELVLPESRYDSRAPQTQAVRGIVDRLQQLPGVLSAATVIGAPLEPRGGIGHTVIFADRPPEPPGQQPGARLRPVHGDYFNAMGLRLVAGRAFDTRDDDRGAPVAVVNETFAKLYWPTKSALGERIAWRASDTTNRWMTIVGIVGDVKSRTMDVGDEDAVYTPYLQRDEEWQRFGTIVVRTKGNPSELARAMREAVWAVDPTIPLANVQTMDSRVSTALAPRRFSALTLATFAVAALLLAVQGLYAVLAYSVTQRRRELGVRSALGARSGELLVLVLRRGMALVGLGLLAGAAGALALGGVMRSVLFGVEPADAVTFGAVTIVLGAASLVACLVPAMRAAKLSPMAALRES